ncbi:DUF6221 family protein [Streptosporangium amethystogenes]|uniref:DUF6221 family protein n=1 Tax=Streptosporangium amethystogenes TaxID=2002 RepID=UPI003CCBD8D8
MDELLAFLHARLDEDEQAARTAAEVYGKAWWWNPGWGLWSRAIRTTVRPRRSSPSERTPSLRCGLRSARTSPATTPPACCASHSQAGDHRPVRKRSAFRTGG